MKQLIIVGAGGHGKVVADIASKNGYESIAFLDDNTRLKVCGKFPVAGVTGLLEKYTGDVFVAIGNAEIRQQIMERIEGHNNVPTLVHPNAVISDDVSIGAGTVIMAGTVINSGTMIGKGCIINTCASVDHECTVGDYAHISVGAHLAGMVTIGKKTWIGIGAAVSNNIDVCEMCTIGAGGVVIKNIAEPGTYVGVPVRLLGK